MKLPVTITITTKDQLKGVRAALEYGYDDVKETFADGSGESSPQQEGLLEIMDQLGI